MNITALCVGVYLGLCWGLTYVLYRLNPDERGKFWPFVLVVFSPVVLPALLVRTIIDEITELLNE